MTHPHPLQPLAAALASDFPEDWRTFSEPMRAYWLRLAERVSRAAHLIPNVETKERAA